MSNDVKNNADQLFKSEAKVLYSYANRFLKNETEAEDVVNDVFEIFLRKVRESNSIENPRLWLFKVLRNRCLDHLRRQRRRAEAEIDSDDWQENLMDLSINAEQKLIAGNTLKIVKDTIDILPFEQAECLMLIVMESLSYAQVAEITGVPIGTVRSRLSTARKTLRLALLKSQSVENSTTSNVVSLSRKKFQ